MVRTMDSGTRASGAKAPRKGLNAQSVSAGSSSKIAAFSSGGGNPVCPRDTPAWQKPITTFFTNSPDKVLIKEQVSESSMISQTFHQSEDNNGIKHIDKKIRISIEDTDEENKENRAQKQANSDEKIPLKKIK